MPFVTFTVRRGLSAADKSRLSEAMLEAQVAAGYQRADRFHRFLEVDHDDLLVDLRFSHFVTSMTAPIASGWSDCRVGFSPTGKRRLCTAHASNGHGPFNDPVGAGETRPRAG